MTPRARSWFSPLWRRAVPRGGPHLETLRTGRFVALDLETTGLDVRRDAIVAAAAIPFVGSSPERGCVTLVDPGRPIPAESTRIHGITDADVLGAPVLANVLPALEDTFADDLVVGHGVEFDLAILARECRAHGRRTPSNHWLDTLRLAAALEPRWPDYEIETLGARLGVVVEGRHTADGDARTAGRLFLSLLPLLMARGITTLPEAIWFQRTAAPRR